MRKIIGSCQLIPNIMHGCAIWDYDGNTDTIYDRLKSCKEKGAVGIGELMINRRLDDPFFRSLFEAAGKLHLPVTFHMSLK